MRYLGGKHRQGKAIAEHVMHVWEPGMAYYEPFCGALGSSTRVVQAMSKASTKRLRVHLSDHHEALISMWRAVMLDGWVPPKSVSEAAYKKVKARRVLTDPLTGFCGHGLSFAGMWFGVYARSKTKPVNYATAACRGVLLKAGILTAAGVDAPKLLDYRKVRPSGAVMYLDPPYANGYQSGGKKPFDHEEYWRYASDMTRKNIVLATEFTAPDGWLRVFDWGDTVSKHYSSLGPGTKVESIFVHVSQAHLFTETV